MKPGGYAEATGSRAAGGAPDLELRNLEKTFGAVRAVNDISLRIERGEFVTLLGPSGCGKTTTLRMVAGLEQPTAGSIIIQGQRVEGVPAYRRNVNTVFQNYALFPHMTVFDNVAFGLTVKRHARDEIRRRVEEILARIKLPGFAGRRPFQLSGGQQQRVALARALVNNPAILLLDEPLGALDLKLRKEMQLELKRIQRDVGITFVYVTHDQEEALTLSDRIVIMSHGKIEQVGTPVEVYQHPRTRFVADFVGVSNFIRGIVREGRERAVSVTLGSLGDARARSGEEFLPGTPVLVSVRPESLVLARDRTECRENLLEATIEEMIYLGSIVQVVVRLKDGTLLQCQDHYARVAEKGFRRDEGVLITWLPADGLAFKAEE
ncbi:MAG TPA: ABC transporter ATP-binding protein [Candidatus Methylomirabilis sp.]|nr:ABC transporter ATP-binding protein [Candidatus Methylomirabilis sp.]HSC70677.1 ABC transporter ATP-binding protein [Candidatus Methylomirabilis sp.]